MLAASLLSADLNPNKSVSVANFTAFLCCCFRLKARNVAFPHGHIKCGVGGVSL